MKHTDTEDVGKVLMRYGPVLLQNYTVSQPGNTNCKALPMKSHYVQVKYMVWPHCGGSSVFWYSESAKRRPDTLIEVSMLFPSRSRQIHGPVLQIRTRCNKIKGLIVILIVETKSMSDKSFELNRLKLLSAQQNVIERSGRETFRAQRTDRFLPHPFLQVSVDGKDQWVVSNIWNSGPHRCD